MVDPSDDYEDRARSQRELDKYERLHKEARELKQELTTKIKTILENQSFKDYFAYTSRNLCNSLHLASGIKDSSFLGMLIPYTSKRRPGYKNEDGYTQLYLAENSGNRQAVDALILSGANIEGIFGSYEKTIDDLLHNESDLNYSSYINRTIVLHKFLQIVLSREVLQYKNLKHK